MEDNKKMDLDLFFVKDEELDETLLATIVSPYLDRILPDGTPEYTIKFSKLNASKKILVHLLIQKIKSIKNGNTKSEEVGIKFLLESKNILDVGIESIKKSFNRELKRFIKRGDEGYTIPNYNLKKVKEYLQNG